MNAATKRERSTLTPAHVALIELLAEAAVEEFLNEKELGSGIGLEPLPRTDREAVRMETKDTSRMSTRQVRG